MRAAVLTRFGGPEAVELRTVPDLHAGPGPGAGAGDRGRHQQHRPLDPGGRLRAARRPRRPGRLAGPGGLPADPGRRRGRARRGGGGRCRRRPGRSPGPRRPRHRRGRRRDRGRPGARTPARGRARQRARRRVRRARRRRGHPRPRHVRVAAVGRRAGLPAACLRHGDGHARTWGGGGRGRRCSSPVRPEEWGWRRSSSPRPEVVA